MKNANQSDLKQLLQVALGHCQSGRNAEAAALYRQVLASHPGNAEALHNLGLLTAMSGRLSEAGSLLERAVLAEPSNAIFHSNLANVLHQTEEFDQAAAHYQRALQIKPDFVEALVNYGTTLQAQGRQQEALARFNRALSLRPSFAPALNGVGSALFASGQTKEALAYFRHAAQLNPNDGEIFNNLGLALIESNQLDEAVACLKNAVRLNPQQAYAHNSLGNAYFKQGQLDPAIQCFEQALRCQPDYADAYNNLGNALQKQARLEQALAAYREAIRLKPELAEAHNNMGRAQQDLGRLDEATASIERALAINPRYAGAHNNRGMIFDERGEPDRAMDCYATALELQADYAEAHWNQSLILLLRGDFLRGWQAYEYRRLTEQGKPHARNFRQPMWDGRDIGGKTLLLHAEQGLGDTIQFSRYAVLLRDQGIKVILECQPALAEVLSCLTDIQIISRDQPLPEFDLHAPLLSLPGIMKTSLDHVPASVPYLVAEPARVQQWRRRLADYPTGIRIGVVWAGNPNHTNDRNRSCRLSEFQPLTALPGLVFFSLQKGGAERQIADNPTWRIHDLGKEFGNFSDTAGAIENLDLIISVDTSVAHLAGAMNKPVWILLPFVPDWRWLLEREDSPWYPGMRIFRQRTAGGWADVIVRIRAALEQLLQNRRA